MVDTNNNGNGSKTFIKITNQDIYKKISSLEKEIREYHEDNSAEHEKLLGKIILNRWIVGAALAVAGFAVVWIWQVAIMR